MISSSAFGMEFKKKLEGLTYERLKELEQLNEKREEAFNDTYPNNGGELTEEIIHKRNAISYEARALRYVMTYGGFCRNLKSHDIKKTTQESTGSNHNNNDQGNKTAEDKKTGARTHNQAFDNECLEKELKKDNELKDRYQVLDAYAEDKGQEMRVRVHPYMVDLQDERRIVRQRISELKKSE